MRYRITPAGAGKTRMGKIQNNFKRDHPRRCGENYSSPGFGIWRLGSPPQVRGKRGIIPAPFGAGWDHPRRCGENCIVHLKRSAGQGSPPQVRGKRQRPCASRALDRITPAGAGKTKQEFFLVVLSKDHPRRCGENYNNWLILSSV